MDAPCPAARGVGLPEERPAAMVMVDWLSSWTRLYDGKRFADRSVPLAGMGGLVATELCRSSGRRRSIRHLLKTKRPPFLQMAVLRDEF
jgi:hypothetical protein